MQDLVTYTQSVTDPIQGYLNVRISLGSMKIVKTSEDGNVAGIPFTVSGNGINRTIYTTSAGEIQVDNLTPGTYTVAEQPFDQYAPQESRQVTVVSGQTATVTFNNTLRRGDLVVTKTAEDGLVEGVKFHLYGTSMSGIPVDEYAVTDSTGRAYFRDVLAGTGYTLEELDVPGRYVVPDSQSAAIEWNTVTQKSFENRLKKWNATVTKRDGETGTAQGDASLAGTVYGVFNGGELVDTYTTDATGQFILSDEKFPVVFEYAGQDTALVEIKANNGAAIGNRLIYGSIHGLKKDDDGNALAGALMGLFRAGETEFTADNALMTATSSEDGSFGFDRVPYGNWLVREIESPTGFLLSEVSYPVEISEDGAVIEVEVENTRIRGTVQLTKVDEDYPDNKLTGAEFDVYRDSNGNQELDAGDELVGTMTEVSTGVYELSGVEFGGHFVKERVAPEGFCLDESAHYFEITAHNEVVVVENEAGVGFVNAAQVGSLKIVKTSSDKNVEGFSFRVTGPNGYEQVFTTNADGEILIEGLRIGEYQVSEVLNEKSANYVLPADKTAGVLADSVTTVQMHNELRDTPKTGDDSNPALWAALMGVSVLGAGACGVAYVKTRKKNEDVE